MKGGEGLGGVGSLRRTSVYVSVEVLLHMTGARDATGMGGVSGEGSRSGRRAKVR